MKKAIITNISLALFFCLLCTLAGCSKDDASEGVSGKSEVLVTMNLSEASWGIEQSAGQTKASASEVSIPVQGGVLIGTLERSAPAQTRTDINYGVRYRLVAYKENDVSATGYVSHADFVKGGAAPTFWLQTEKTYTLVCYSYNSTDALPDFDKSMLEISVSPANDCLYCLKNVAITESNRSFSLELAHLFSGITVTADASGGDVISACSGTFTPNYNATLSLIDGSLTKGSSVSKAINWNSFGSVTATSTPAQVYTAGETITLTLDSITIGGTTRVNLTASFGSNTMQAGSKYTLRLKFMKRDVLISNLKQEMLRKSIDLYGKMWNERKITIGELKMLFDYKVFGTKPAGGRSLYISMHGGGGTTTEENDQQWRNQIILYAPTEGVYLAPRAPWDAWNMWFKPEMDAFFEVLIRTAIAKMEVDPNKVYLLGYSAGGDGVWRMAPRMADCWAASSMMAGHPGEASQINLRNVPFMIWMGEYDTAYQRNLLAVEKGIIMDKLQAGDPDGYIHETHIVEGKPHWMDGVDAAALPWMANYKRNPLPKKIVWRQEEVTRTSMYWLALNKEVVNIQQGMEVVASYEGNSIVILSCDYPNVLVRLNDKMMNLDLPVTVKYKDAVIFTGMVPWSENVAIRTSERGDPDLMFYSEISVNIPNL